MILLNSDVAWFCPRPSNLVLLLKDNGCETSTPGGVAKNVSDIVVTKQQRRPMVTARRVISEHVHSALQAFPSLLRVGHGKGAKSGTRSRNFSAVRKTSDCMPRPRPGTGGARSQSLACGIVQARNRLCARADDRASRASTL